MKLFLTEPFATKWQNLDPFKEVFSLNWQNLSRYGEIAAQSE